MLSESRPEYHGIVLHETFGNFAFAIACRVLALRDLGPALSPFNAFLTLTGIETLPLRMQRHCDNALAVAQWLADQREVAWVSYPGLAGDRYHNLAKRYVPKGAGSCFTFGLKGGYDAGVRLVSNVKLFSHLANIGDTRSLIIHPASTTHRRLDNLMHPAARERLDRRKGRAAQDRLGEVLWRGGVTHDLYGDRRERNPDEKLGHADTAAVARHQPPVGGAGEHATAGNGVPI